MYFEVFKFVCDRCCSCPKLCRSQHCCPILRGIVDLAPRRAVAWFLQRRTFLSAAPVRMLAKVKACLTCQSADSNEKQPSSSAMAPTTPEAQPGTSTAGVSPPASPVTATDDRAGGAGAHVQEQQKRQEADPEDLPAAAQGRAQKALQAVKERPKNSTDPDAGACWCPNKSCLTAKSLRE